MGEREAFWVREAKDNTNRAIGCIFEIVSQITGVRGIPEPHNFFNAAMYQRFAEQNADEALLCAAKAAPFLKRRIGNARGAVAFGGTPTDPDSILVPNGLREREAAISETRRTG